MNVYGLDDTFSWFIAGAGGSHELKFGAQYQLGEHYREDQRFMNGAFQFTTDRVFNAADPSTYPERLTIRVPQMVQLLSRTHSLGLYVQDKWQMTQHLTLSLGLRYDVHVSPLDELWNPFFTDPDAVSDRQEQLPAARRLRLQPRARRRSSAAATGSSTRSSGSTGSRTIALNRVFTNSFQAQFPTAQADPGPSRGQLPDRSAARQRTDAEPGAGRSARPSGHAGPEHGRGVARYAGSDSSLAAPGVDRLRAPARPPAVVRGRLHAHRRTRICRCATT